MGRYSLFHGEIVPAERTGRSYTLTEVIQKIVRDEKLDLKLALKDAEIEVEYHDKDSMARYIEIVRAGTEKQLTPEEAAEVRNSMRRSQSSSPVTLGYLRETGPAHFTRIGVTYLYGNWRVVVLDNATPEEVLLVQWLLENNGILSP